MHATRPVAKIRQIRSPKMDFGEDLNLSTQILAMSVQITGIDYAENQLLYTECAAIDRMTP
jgi:hypothetical protein